MADGDVDIPKVGKLPKKVLIPLGVGVAGFVAWRFYAARNAASDGETSPITDGEFGAVDSSVPDTLNPFPGSFSGVGSGSTSTTTGDRDGDGIIGPGEFTNNGQWTDYVVSKLSAADNWAYADIVTALGNGLAGRPTTSVQQDILRAAIAVGGQPPVGSLTIVGGGNTDLTVAPSVSAGAVTDTTAMINFTPVSGATSYAAYRSGADGPVGTAGSSPIRVTGLAPGTSYSVQVAGLNAAGTPGPKSPAVTVKTAAAASSGPISARVTTPTKNTIYTVFKDAPGATRYRVTLNGKLWREITGSPFTITGLQPNTRYTIGIAGINASGAAGPVSTTTIRTKK